MIPVFYLLLCSSTPAHRLITFQGIDIVIDESPTDRGTSATIQTRKGGKDIERQVFANIESVGGNAGLALPREQPFAGWFTIVKEGDYNTRLILVGSRGQIANLPMGGIFYDQAAGIVFALRNNEVEPPSVAIFDLKNSLMIVPEQADEKRFRLGVGYGIVAREGGYFAAPDSSNTSAQEVELVPPQTHANATAATEHAVQRAWGDKFFQTLDYVRPGSSPRRVWGYDDFLGVAGRSTNAVVWMPEFRAWLKNAFPTQMVADDSHQVRVADYALDVLGGPPDPVRVIEKKYVVLSACRAHSCGDKGFLWVDVESHRAWMIRATQTLIRDPKESPPKMFIYPTLDGQPGDWPKAFKSSVESWLDENQIELGGVVFARPNGKTEFRSDNIFDYARALPRHAKQSGLESDVVERITTAAPGFELTKVTDFFEPMRKDKPLSLVRADIDGDGREDIAALVINRNTHQFAIVLLWSASTEPHLIEQTAWPVGKRDPVWKMIAVKPAGQAGISRREYFGEGKLPQADSPAYQKERGALVGEYSSAAAIEVTFGAHPYDKNYGYCTAGYYMRSGKLDQVMACD